jgi:ribosomal small subunit protein bTHX
MGKGDPKSKRGKIWRGSYGVRRQKKKTTAGGSNTSPE